MPLLIVGYEYKGITGTESFRTNIGPTSDTGFFGSASIEKRSTNINGNYERTKCRCLARNAFATWIRWVIVIVVVIVQNGVHLRLGPLAGLHLCVNRPFQRKSGIRCFGLAVGEGLGHGGLWQVGEAGPQWHLAAIEAARVVVVAGRHKAVCAVRLGFDVAVIVGMGLQVALVVVW